MIIAEFYGHVRKTINHPEAAWILDDTYRGLATPAQKARLLSEWYGTEFAIFGPKGEQPGGEELSVILANHPEKRKPILDHLFSLINQLVQKKMTGFTILHDAMLNYFQAIKPFSEEATALLQLLHDEESSDLLKNLAFTQSGARLVSLALAYGAAKDRRRIIQAYKDTLELIAYDANAYIVLLTAYDVVDDTVFLSKIILNGLLGKTDPKAIEETGTAESQQQQAILSLVLHPLARTTILYPLIGYAKWLFSADKAYSSIRDTIIELRSRTSKKAAETRMSELTAAMGSAILSTIVTHTTVLAETTFGCQFIAQTLLVLSQSENLQDMHARALSAVAALCTGSPAANEKHIAHSAAGVRMLKTLIHSGRYDKDSGAIQRTSNPLGFSPLLWNAIKRDNSVLDWACCRGSFVIVALLEADEFDDQGAIKIQLKAEEEKLQAAQEKVQMSPNVSTTNGESKEPHKADASAAGLQILLGKLEMT